MKKYLLFGPETAKTIKSKGFWNQEVMIVTPPIQSEKKSVNFLIESGLYNSDTYAKRSKELESCTCPLCVNVGELHDQKSKAPQTNLRNQKKSS